MRSIYKENLKDSFLEFLEFTKANPAVKKEIISVLHYHGVVQSSALEYGFLSPWFLYPHHNNGSERVWDKLLPEYYQLQLETVSLYEEYEKLFNDKLGLTPENILNVHRRIFERSRYNLAGKYRTEDNASNINGDCLPHHSLFPDQLKQNLIWTDERLNYIGQVNNDNFFEIMYLAAEIHFRMITSAPFACGNGMMARLISDYILINCGMVNIVYSYDNIEEYKQVLKESAIENIKPLSDFQSRSFYETFKPAVNFIDRFNKSLSTPKI